MNDIVNVPISELKRALPSAQSREDGEGSVQVQVTTAAPNGTSGLLVGDASKARNPARSAGDETSSRTRITASPLPSL